MKMLQDSTVKVVTVPESLAQQPSSNANDSGRLNKKWICGIVGILVGLVIVASTVLLAVHFGGKAATNAIKEYQVNLRKNDGTTVTEKVSVSETEEKYEADGSDFQVVYDTKNGLVVYKVQTTDRSICFIRPLNSSEVASPDRFENVQNGTSLSEGSSEEQYTDTYTTTGIELKNRDLLSPMAREMCEGSPIMWLDKDHEGGRTKRRTAAYPNCRFGKWIIYSRRKWYRVLGTVCFNRTYTKARLRAGYRVIESFTIG